MRYSVWLLLAVIAAAVMGAVYLSAEPWDKVAYRDDHPRVIDWSAVTDDPSERLEVSWLVIPRFPNGSEDAYGFREIEKLFNIKIKPLFLDADSYMRRKPLMFSGGDIPDVVWEGDPVDIQKDAMHGCIVPLPREFIKQHAPNYYRFLCETAPISWLYSWYNGYNWGIPSAFPKGVLPYIGVWRKDWLDKVGITKEPDTLAEFHEAFRRFTFNDPDGNGLNDTYGLSGNASMWFLSFTEFYGAFGVIPFGWMERDGTVAYGGVLPETRAALATLRDWYAEGILDPEFVTDGGDRTRQRNKFIFGNNGYLSFYCLYEEFLTINPVSMVNLLAKYKPDAAIIPAVAPLGPQGKRGSRNWGAGGNILSFGPSVLDNPRIAIRILKIMDYAFTCGYDEYIRLRFGIKGKHWDFLPTGGITRLPPYDDKNKYQQEVCGECLLPENPEFQDKAELEFNRRYLDAKLTLTDAFGKPDSTKAAQKFLGDLRNWQLSVYTEIIRGERPLEYFDEFVRIWHERGGRQMTEEANQLLAVKKRIYAEIGAEPGK